MDIKAGNFNLGKSISIHILLIFVLSLLLLIPKLFFDFVLSDRQMMLDSALHSITDSWAHEQLIAPPVLAFKGQKTVFTDSDPKNWQKQDVTLFLLPEDVAVTAKLKGEERKRGIYNATLYRAQIDMKGSFDLGKLKESVRSLGIESLRLVDSTPLLYFFLSDAAGIEEVQKLEVNGQSLKAKPGAIKLSNLDSFMAHFDDDLKETVHFDCSYTVRGSLSFAFRALADSAKLNVEGLNLNPGFKGRFLPSKREVQDKTFTANYMLTSLASGYTDLYLDDIPDFNNDIMIDIQDSSQHYTFIERLSKYALLFIGMTFVTILAFELVSGKLISLVQYVTVGAALLLFYLVLLSLSEHLSFTLSYTCAALLMSVLIALYMKAAFKSYKKGITVFLVLVALYIILYTIVNAQTYALLLGTGLLVLMLCIVMYITRHIGEEKTL